MLNEPMPALEDEEGGEIPPGLPPVVDAHVHVFPDSLFSAIWEWFDRNAWKVRYRLRAADVVSFLVSRGIRNIVALQYAHKPGVSRELNRFMAELCERLPMVSGLASVFPGEADSAAILQEAFQSGLAGVKLHAHVQCFDMNSPEMNIIYKTCSDWGKPLVMHAGREPKSPAYACDPYQICSAEKLENVLKAFPALKICVPHLGFDEHRTYQGLMERYDNLWLDTAMVMTDFFPGYTAPDLSAFRKDRILYGTDFPNIPFAWDRELKEIVKARLPERNLERLLGKNAAELFGIQL